LEIEKCRFQIEKQEVQGRYVREKETGISASWGALGASVEGGPIRKAFFPVVG
jgi:hypothetical protein